MLENIKRTILLAIFMLSCTTLTAHAQTTSAIIKTGAEPSAGTPANPVYNPDSDTTTWDYVYFGSYPQKEVTDSTTIEAIENAIKQNNSKTEGTIGKTPDTGIDVWVNGVKYRRIEKTQDTANDHFFGDSTYRYFKWERIKWRVLQNNGTDLFIMANTALDCQKYHDTETAITWEYSTLRKWLNESFYRTAFSDDEQNAILEQTVVNEDNTHYNPAIPIEGGNNTKDKVYLLSLEEVKNENYGFSDDTSRHYSNSRKSSSVIMQM